MISDEDVKIWYAIPPTSRIFTVRCRLCDAAMLMQCYAIERSDSLSVAAATKWREWREELSLKYCQADQSNKQEVQSGEIGGE